MHSRTTSYYIRHPRCPVCGLSIDGRSVTCPICKTPLLVDSSPLPINRYRIIRAITRTSAGSLFEAINVLGRRYYLKRMIPATGEGGHTLIDAELAGLHEIAGLACAPHHARAFVVNEECYLVFPAIAGVLLSEASHKPWDAAQVMGFLDVALETIAHLHRRGVLLRNLTPGNLIYTSDQRLLLIDYGMFVPRRADPFAAPDYVQQQAATYSIDLYHIGATAYSLLSGGNPPRAQRGQRPADGLDVPNSLRNTLNELLGYVPGPRQNQALDVLSRLRGAHWTPMSAQYWWVPGWL